MDVWRNSKGFDLVFEDFVFWASQVCHETVLHFVPRWQHDIAWAKERAKQIHACVKSAEEAGRGVLQLTEKGREYYKYLIKQLEPSVILRKKRKNT